MINTDKLILEFCEGNIEAHHFFSRLHFEELARFAGSTISNMEQGIKLVEEAIIKVWYRDNMALHTLQDIKTVYFLNTKYACTQWLQYKESENYRTFRQRIEAFVDAELPVSIQSDLQTLENAGPQSVDCARKILQLAFSKPMSDEEIAGRLSITVGEVAHGLTIARQAIRVLLSKNF